MRKILIPILFFSLIVAQDKSVVDDTWKEDVWIVSTNTYDKEDSSEWDIIASVNGKITHGDRLRIRFVPESYKNYSPCETAMMITSFYTTATNAHEKIEQLNSPFLEANLLGQETYVKIMHSFPAMIGHMAYVDLGVYPLEAIKGNSGTQNEISIELKGANKDEIDIKSIFDVPRNLFSTEGLNEAVDRAKSECLKLIKD